ncbi:MAG: DNA mismatch repair endonuclease MutL [Clostridia bacterium]|nr:DNA mismatch repair endonuclease MutL [Clostridia bacterium]
MAEIRVLSSSVADKIAAGEVAERPSAVVKELVENAIDAGADKIEVEIKQGGVGYIRVTDNGCGIPRGQVKTAFLRHATSKLTEIDDLYRISTMGFRGEALASICAVSQVEIVTKTADAEEGTFLSVANGKAEEESLIACGDGTTMVVENLFANVPARMKFLKKDSTEAGYVADVLSRIALSRPEISFTYICDGNEIFATAGDGKLENVILNLYGLEHAKAILPVDYTEEKIRIHGVVGKPEISRGNRSRQTLFVNGRYVKNHVLSKVAEEAFRNRMMVGKFPFFVLHVDLPAELVDVNVHPAKTEVKFANEKQIYDVAYHAIKNALYVKEETVSVQEKSIEQPMPKMTVSAPISNYSPQPQRVNPILVREYMDATIPKEMPSVSSVKEPTPVKVNIIEETPFKQEVMEELQSVLEMDEPAKIIGQIFDTYIICQQGDEVFFIDQHAAHERMRFETLKESYQKKEKFTQMLLSPIVLNLDFREKQTVMEHLSGFLMFGFDMDDFGGNAVIINGTPVAMDESRIRDLMLELSDAMEQQRQHPIADFEEAALDMIACKGAIKANKHLSYVEMQDLVQRVAELETQGVNSCPHGRPIRITFTKDEIEKLFKRKL